MNKSKKLLITLGVLIVLVAGAGGYLLYTSNNSKVNTVEEPKQEVIEEVKQEPEYFSKWNENKAINPDYVGEVVFDSGLIDKSFVQAKDVYDYNGNPYKFYTSNGHIVEDIENYTGNDVYIWTNWRDFSYDYNILGGSVFMDYRNELIDENIIIYGHHFSVGGGNDPERIKAFTPLEKLMEVENYAANKTVKLLLDHEVRSYELVGVYRYDTLDDFYIDNLQYYRTEYNYDEFEDVRDENYYSNYIKALDEVKLYKTDTSLTTSDKTLTLQTCIAGYDERYFEICVFKQVGVENYN